MKRVRKSQFLAVVLGLSVLCGTTLADVTGLEVIGPGEVAENFRASYKAIAYYDDKGATSTMDVTDLALWMVEPNIYASIDKYGILTTKYIVKERSATIMASYAEGDITVDAEKVVNIFPICPSGYALEFDGGNDYVDCGNDNNLDINDVITVEAWVRRNSTNRYDYAVSKYDTGYSRRSWMLIAGDNDSGHENDIGVIISKDGWLGGNHSTFLRGGSEITDTSWHHIAFTYRYISDGSSNLKLYLDGQLDLSSSTAVGPIYSSDTPVRIGVIAIDGILDRYFNGTIDEVSIYNRALSAEEIRVNMHTRLAGDEPGLVGYWDFDEGGGQIVYDLSGNGNDGQLGATTDFDNSDPTWVKSDAPIGICTPYLSATMTAERVIEHKIALIEELLATLAQEWAVHEVLEELLESGDYGDMYKGDIVTAKQKIHSVTQHGEQAIDALQKSIEKLEDSLSALGFEPASSEPSPPLQPPPPPPPSS